MRSVGARDGDAAAALEAGGEPGLGLQRLVQPGRVLHEPRAALARAQLADQPGRVPGRAARQPALLEQQHVGDAELRQVVGDAGADDAAADDRRRGRGRAGVASSALSPCAARRRAAGRTRRRRTCASAASYFSMPHSQKSKSIGLVARLDRRPQRPPVARHQALQLGPREPARTRTAVVGGDELVELVVVEVALAPDVAELEAGVVVAGVLVVDEPDLVAVVDEVRRQQVVVARARAAPASRGERARGCGRPAARGRDSRSGSR